MKVLYIHQYFKTPNEGGSIRSYYLASELIKAGHEVIMISAHNEPKKKQLNVDGIHVTYLPISYDNKMSFKRRILAFLHFSLLASIESLNHRNIDLCYVMTTPLTTGFTALFNKIILRRPYIFEVGDLWPKVPIDMGLIGSTWQIKMLIWAERLFYKEAKGLVGLSSPITDHLQSFDSAKPCETIFNISNCEFFNTEKKDPKLEEKYQVKNKFIVSYTGTFGYANDLMRMLEWIQAVKDLPVHFLLVGDGAEKENIRREIIDQSINNVTLMDHVPQDQIREILNVTDAVLISFLQVASLHTGSPNKLFDGLASGKLIITSFGGWISELLEKNQCGGSCLSPTEFKQFLLPFLDSKEKLTTYQRNASVLAEEQFSLKIQTKKWLQFISKLN